MNGSPILEVRLLSDGRARLSAAGSTPAVPDGAWQILGYVRQGGQRMGFVRAEIDGESWASLIGSERLEQGDSEPLVTLERQTTEPHAPLAGWIQFC
jgi:hypothetical protein